MQRGSANNDMPHADRRLTFRMGSPESTTTRSSETFEDNSNKFVTVDNVGADIHSLCQNCT